MKNPELEEEQKVLNTISEACWRRHDGLGGI